MMTNLRSSSVARLRFLLVILVMMFATTEMWGAEDDTHNFSQSISQGLNNCATFDDIVISEQDYSIKSVIITYAYNKSASPKATVSIGNEEIGTQSFAGTGNLTTTKTLTFTPDSPIKGEVRISNTAGNSCSGSGKGTLKITNICLVEGSSTNPPSPHIVKFYITSTQFETEQETSAGDGVFPPNMEQKCGDWTFQGWSESDSDSETNTTGLDLVSLTDGKYYPTDDVTLYPVYSKTISSGNSFSSYKKVTTTLDDWSGKYLLSTGTYTATGEYSNKHLTCTNGAPGNVECSSQEFTLSKVGDVGYSILMPNGNYLGHSSSTDFASSSAVPTTTSTTYLWTPSTNGISNVSATARKISTTNNTDFRPYSSPSSGIVYLYKRIENSSTIYYYSYPSCATEPTQLEKPTNLKVSDVTTTTATLSWDAVANASGYTVVVGSTSHNTNTTSITVENLTASTPYKWSVTAKGNGSTYTDSDATNGSDFTTKTTAPTNYTVTLNPNYPAGKTGVFKDTEENTIDGNLEISLPANTESQTIASLYSSISLESYIFEGWFEAADGNANRTNTGKITQDITFYAHWKVPYTVTFNAGTGNCATESITETTANGIQLPTATLTDCGDWTFLGWAEAAIASETTTPPASILAGGSTYKPTGNITLYAIYKRVEGGGGGEGTEATLSFADKAQRTEYTEDIQVWTENGITLTNNKAESTNPVGDYANPARFYKSSEIIISAPGTIAEIVATTSGSDYTTALKNSVGAEASANGNVVTITPTESNTTYTIKLTGGQVRLNSITVTYGGGLSTSYYHSNPVCQTCENILTISKGAETNGTFTLDISGDIETCETEVSVVVKPTPANHYHIGSVTATTPTTGGAPTVTDNDNGTYTITYAQDSKGESTISVTFVEDAKASITLSELGVPTTDNTTYYVGETYTLPSTSSQSCDGKQLVGWSTVEVAETDTKPTENYYERGAEVTLAATQTFFAVFAAGSGGGGTGAVTSTSDLEAGATYAISNEATEGTYLSTWDGGNNFDGSTSTICPLVLGGSEGAWTFQISDGSTHNDKYLTATSAESNRLKAVNPVDDYSYFTISFDNNGNAVITCTGKDVNNILRFNANNGSPIFACYTSGLSPVYLQKYATGGGGYTAYTTSCIPTYSITYDFADGTGSHCSNTSVPQGNTYTICDEAPTKEGYTFQGWSDGTTTHDAGATITPEDDITFTAVWKANTYTVTWNNNDDTDEVTYNHGDALVVPTAPASCDGVKEFVGWTTHSGYYHATIAPDDIFTTKTTPVTATATYYAVFATPPTTGGGSSIETTYDVLTRETTEVASGSTTYASWSGKTTTSNAIYAGNSAGSHDAIQLRSTDNSGIVSTASGGKVTRVEVEWNENTSSDRTLDIYGRNVAYTDASDLYNANTQGTKLGSIAYGTSIDLEIDGTYEYIGLRSNKNAMYLNSITITWSSAGGSSSYTDYTTICQEVTGIAISGSYPTTFVQYDSFSFAGGIVTATFENGATQDVTSLATFSDYNMDEVGVQTVTVTYMGQTAKYEITINQSDRWRLTWNVSGKTNTGASPIYVQKGSAIGTLPTPEVPAACAGKTFMGWTESNIVPSDGKGIVYITEETVPTKNTTYYAVFATINNFSTQAAIEDIESGSKVVIVAVASMDASGGAGQAISSRTISITSQGVIGLSGDEVSIFDETINTPHSTCIWTLTKEGGGIVFEQGGKYIRAVNDGYRKLLLETTIDYWTLSPVTGKDKTYHMQSGNTSHYVEWFDHTDSKYDEGERYIGFVPYLEANDNGDFDMQFYVTANADGNADITDYTTGCAEYTITYYGFHGGYSTSCSSDGTIVLPVNSTHTIPNCEGLVINDHTNLGREFLNVWMTQPHGGHTFKPGDTFILTQDTTLYAQWELETTSDVTTLPTDIKDLAGTDIYVYGGKTLNIQPGTTTINSLTLKGGLQSDGSYKMPTVWVPEGATLVRNSNKINLDLIVNAKTYYPFAVPFAAKNNENVEYLDPVLAAASTYGTHFAIKTYNGARRAEVGEDKANNWVRVLRGETLQPGVGYIITALTYPTEDTATIRIPMTVSNTWFKNGEQAEVGTTVRNTIAVTAHAGDAATEHQRHAGWNFVANPYLTSFAGDNVDNDGGLAYINGELIIEGSYEYTDEEVPYVTVPAYDFAYYSQHKLSDVKLSPEWSFFVQVGTGGTMNFTTAGRQQAPAHLAARAAEQPIKMDVDLILSDNHNSDQTGIIISDRYSDAYEIGRDLEKLFGSAYNLSVYTLMADNTPLAFQALAIQNSMQLIPVGYRTPAQGEYTFALNEATSDIELLNEQYEQLILVDYETGALTNMLNNEYTFYSDRTQSNNRFALYAVPRQNTTTDLPNTIGNEEVKKVIYNDHFYILRNGKVFNGAGQIVK